MLGKNMQHWINESISQELWFAGNDGDLITDNLVGVLAVNRVMSAAVALHLILLPLVIGVKNTGSARAAIQNSCWLAKILIWIALTVSMWFLPNELFQMLSATVFRVGGALFVLVQLVQLVDFVHEFRNTVYANRGNVENDRDCWFCLLVLLTVLSYAWTFVIAIWLIIQNGDTEEGCAEGVVGAITNVLLCFAVSILSIATCVREAENNSNAQANGIFQSGCISAYCMYLVVSAMFNHPEARCRPFPTDNADVALRMIGVLFTFVSVSYFAIRERSVTGAEPQAQVTTDPSEEKKVQDDEQDAVKYTYWVFHAFMALAAMYLAMLLTGWNTIEDCVGTAEDCAQQELVIDRSMASVWIKIASSWVCYMLYALTLVLPPCCPGRQFGANSADLAAP